MKRRVRSQPTNPFYSDEPAVAKSLIADKALAPSAALANRTSKSIDKHPGRLSGIAGFAQKNKPPQQKMQIKAPAFGTKAKQPAQLRMSGNSKAHRIGFKG
jgi:hypothetical protein